MKNSNPNGEPVASPSASPSAATALVEAPSTPASESFEAASRSVLERLQGIKAPEALKEPVLEADLVHRDFRDGRFWSRIGAFADVTEEQFLDWRWQTKNSVQNASQLDDFLSDLVEPEFLADVRRGMKMAPMNMRLTPYILSLIDWHNPYDDPLRIQFIPTASTTLPDHPKLSLDSLHEQEDSPTPGLVHRYPDKALFLPLDVCPVYCRFCTRSYAIGTDNGGVEKVSYPYNPKRWDKAFAYLAARPEIEDVVISGGDAFMLSPQHLKLIGQTLLAIPNIRRMRFASKGLAVMPMKVLTHPEWTDTLVSLSDQGRERGKEVCFHTHFNTTNEITDITRQAMHLLFKRGVKVRNQSVLIRGVNDSVDEMTALVRQLSYMNVQPYYVYQHDMVKGVEELRTPLSRALEIERHVRGSTAGFNTPTFVNDVPGGGGKRDVHSFDAYDEETGIAVYRSPSVDDQRLYLYFDPIDQLSQPIQERWADSEARESMIQQAINRAGLAELVAAH